MRSKRLRTRVRGFVGELRRRRVPRVFVAYAFAAIAVAEGAELFLPALGMGSVAVSAVAVIAALGLPVALLLAWAFDVVPDRGAAPAQPEWSDVQELFDRASRLPRTERTDFVDTAAGADRALAREVFSLLEAQDGDGPLEALGERLALGVPRRAVGELEGQTVGPYALHEKLDDGGMGVVYRATDTRLDRAVALKFLSPRLLAERDADERFAVEARAAASLDHPNLCTIHEVGETPDGLHFIAMAYYEGGSLRQRIRKGRLEPSDALGVAAQLCRGLECAARHGIVHRDIKPANVMFGHDGTVKIVDFGLAKIGAGELTRSGALLGTVSYMSPEQARGDTIDQRTDVWSTGVVLYEMLAGGRPFVGRNDQGVIQAILRSEPEPLEARVDGLSPAVSAIVERALEKDPGRRYPDAASLLRDIECLLEDPDRRSVEGMRPRLPLDGERRQVTVLAGVLGGFDERLHDIGAAEVGEELFRLRTWIAGVVEEYGGVLHEFSEHSVTALFGIPVAHEDDGLRAVRAARELVANTGAHDSPGSAFHLRCGVASELVPVSRSTAAHRTYRIGGSVVRNAALIAAAGRRDDVLLGPGAVRGVAPYLETEPRSPVTMTSTSTPVTPLAVLGECDHDGRLEASLTRGLSHFVGRSEEMAALLAHLERAGRGRGSVVAVVGDAGVGKSRLVHEFRTSVADDGVRFVHGRCQSHGRPTPFLPFTECARAVLGLRRDAAVSRSEDLADLVRGLDPALEAYAPILGHLFQPDRDDAVLGSFSAGEKAAAAVEVLTALFTAGSNRRTLVIVLEDWHWSDEASRQVLDQLSEVTATNSVLVLVTSRTDVATDRTAASHHVVLDLEPLESESTLALARSALGRVRLDRELFEHIEAKTGGNPFFVEELCEHLVESRALDIADGLARLKRDRAPTTIPSTVQSVLKTRLDRLDPESREVLRTASVIGRDFGESLLERVVPSPGRLEGSLRLLRASGLIQRTALIPEKQYRFKHALTLDVAYGSLLERQRRDRHALVGEAIEELYGSEADEWLEPMAHHFSESQRWGPAVRCGMSAARRAARVWRWADALTILDQVEGWMGRRGDGEGDEGPTMVALLLQREESLGKLDLRAEQAGVIERLERLIPPEPTRTRAILLARKVGFLTASGRHSDAASALEEVTATVEACGAHDQKADALRGMAFSLRRLGRIDDAIEALLEVVSYSREHESPDVLLRDLWMLGNAYRARSDFDGAHGIVRELQLLEPRCSPLEQGVAYHFLGRLHRALGEPKKALEAYTAANVRHEVVRLEELAPARKSMHLLSMAALQVELGELGDAMESYAKALLLARRAGPEHLARALTIKADVLAELDRMPEALPLYREAAGMIDAHTPKPFDAEVMTRFAEALDATGDPEAPYVWRRARELLERLEDRPGVLRSLEREARSAGTTPERQREIWVAALQLVLETGDRKSEARIRNSLALLDWRVADLDSASRHYEIASGILAEEDDPSKLGVILNGWGAVLVKAGRLDEAESVLREALEANRTAGGVLGHADTLAALGALYRTLGRTGESESFYESCVELRREAGDRSGEGWALHRLAELAKSAGDGERGRAFGARALSIALEVGDGELAHQCERTREGT